MAQKSVLMAIQLLDQYSYLDVKKVEYVDVVFGR